jgi:periplasmic copper chaperone A
MQIRIRALARTCPFLSRHLFFNPHRPDAMQGSGPMMKKMILSGAALLMTAGAALAHVTLEQGEAPVGSPYKAVLRVPHGCDGKPTIAIRVQIPEGVIAVKPMPKPGWKLDKIKGKYEKTYDYYGTPISEGVKEIDWSGGSLADDEYDEFVLRVMLTPDLSVGQMLYFPLVQECTDGAVERWIQIPAAGQSEDDLETPAPGIKLLKKTGGDD